MKKHLFLSCFLFLAVGCHRSQEQEDPLMVIQIQDRNGITETISAPERIKVYESTDFMTSQPYKKVLRVYKRNGKKHSRITTYHPNGCIWQYLEAEEMRAHGAYREWHSNGQIKIEAQVIGGTADVLPGSQQDWLFEGVSQVWDEQGNLLAQIPYQKGLLEGTSIYYFPSGQIQKQYHYQQNALQGETIEYFPNGQIKTKTFYKRGIRDGEQVTFFPDAKICANEIYTDGLLLHATYWNKEGTLVAEVEKGRGLQALFQEEQLTHLIEIRLGRPDGKITRFAPSGEIQSTYHVKNGKKNGIETEYFLSMEKETQQPLAKLTIEWHDNAIHGTVKTWYPNGQLQSQREYSRNQKLGPSLMWYPDGSLMALEEYDTDRLVKGQYYKKKVKEPVSTVIQGNGVATLFNEEGVFLRKISYAKGKAVDPEE